MRFFVLIFIFFCSCNNEAKTNSTKNANTKSITQKAKATFENPAQYSAGILHVLVNGIAVVQDGKLVEDVKPGSAIRRPLSK